MFQFKIQDMFSFIIQLIICSSVVALFVSILIDFTLYTRDEHTKKEKKSIVETGTMTLFLFVFYLILMTKIGIVPIYNNNLKHIVIIIGTVAIVSGSIMNIMGRFNLGSNWANHIKIYDEHTLVQKGMYKNDYKKSTGMFFPKVIIDLIFILYILLIPIIGNIL